VLEKGRIVECGTHGRLMERGGRYYELYTHQAGLEGNRFINPGEKEREEEEPAEKLAVSPADEPNPLQILRGN
jgi:hypothetical protein